MNSFKLALLYMIFATVATFCNILTQYICIYVYSAVFSIIISMVMGTGVGLVVKYVLDKKYIFKYKTENAQHNGRIFFLYTVMGLLTTMVFWGFELGFHYLFKTETMRYFGGIIGLMIGYICKYYLDKRFVFRTV